ncbi:MAG: polysaccharide ABC transporter ATP-binding protein [Sphingomicrobium sp.]
MGFAAIDVQHLTKRYDIGAAAPTRTLVDTVSGLARRLRQGGDKRSREFWALKDMSFTIPQGEAVGLIGHNGAGKSTLLKILSRVTEPTAGRVTYRGRIGSLLEVGTGFHPQLSGRDNVFLSGAVLGMRHREIARKFDEIVDFSGVEAFIDEPIKHYSSGMYLRLAFAVAAHLETDILLVDEVLAVGDMNFQKKCLGRMESVSREGRTVVFVSHNLTAVQSLCDRAILLKDGTMFADGPVDAVIGDYYADQMGGTSEGGRRIWDPGASTAAVQPLRAAAYPLHGAEGEPVDTGNSFVIEWDYRTIGAGTIDQASITVHDSQGVLLFDQNAWEEPAPFAAGTHRTRCVVPGHLFNDGTYFISFMFRRGGEMVLETPNALNFEIVDNREGRFGWYGKWPGIIRPKLDWSSEIIAP